MLSGCGKICVPTVGSARAPKVRHLSPGAPTLYHQHHRASERTPGVADHLMCDLLAILRILLIKAWWLSDFCEAIIHWMEKINYGYFRKIAHFMEIFDTQNSGNILNAK